MNVIDKINEYHQRIESELSTYPEKIVKEDGKVMVNQVNDSYFLTHDKWNVHFLGEIKQFEEVVTFYKGTKKNVYFRFNNHQLNLEMKYVYFQHLFHDYWKITTVFGSKQAPLKRFTEFINETYPTLSSFSQLNINETKEKYILWLENKGIATTRVKKTILYKDLTIPTIIVSFLRIVYEVTLDHMDERNEWEKERWNIRFLHKKYGVDYNKSLSYYCLDFSTIHEVIREDVKRYLKQRLLSKTLSWATAGNYHSVLANFFSFIFELHPNWQSLSELNRNDMEKYIDNLHEYTHNKLWRRNSHPEWYVSNTLNILQKFLREIQRFEYNCAPGTEVRLLIFKEDIPKIRKKSTGQINHIPDYVLCQLFDHMDDLHPEIVPILLTAFKTGLRISDVLGLKTNCLVCADGKYSIVTDIRKTNVKDHRLPIDEQIASMISTLIQQSKKHSNQENNRDHLIFIRYRGQRKGQPISQNFVSKGLNEFAVRNTITDENGDRFHFKTHQFRYTYAVKLLNGGADIRTIQELLAHASLDMTVRYAQLLDDTKRKAFEAVFGEYRLEY